jgi:hypothetical protein
MEGYYLEKKNIACTKSVRKMFSHTEALHEAIRDLTSPLQLVWGSSSIMATEQVVKNKNKNKNETAVGPVESASEGRT